MILPSLHQPKQSQVSNCEECNKLGWRFIHYFLFQSNPRIEENKAKFIDHWNEVHCRIRNSNYKRNIFVEVSIIEMD